MFPLLWNSFYFIMREISCSLSLSLSLSLSPLSVSLSLSLSPLSLSLSLSLVKIEPILLELASLLINTFGDLLDIDKIYLEQ